MPESNQNPAYAIYRRMVFIILLAALTVMPGCVGRQALTDVSFIQTPVAAPTKTNTSTRHIALVMKTLTNPFFVEMEKGARRAEAEAGIQ